MIELKEKEKLYSPVSFGCTSVDSTDDDYWDEAACFTGTIATGLGAVSIIALGSGVGGPLSVGTGVSGFVLGVTAEALSWADAASK